MRHATFILLFLASACAYAEFPGQNRVWPGQHPPAECQFRFFGDRGQALAQNAQQECVRNLSLPPNARSFMAYQLWKDYFDNAMANRRAEAAAMSRPPLRCRPDGMGGLDCR